MRTVKDTVPLIASLGQDCRQPVRIEDCGFLPTEKFILHFITFNIFGRGKTFEDVIFIHPHASMEIHHSLVPCKLKISV